MPVRMNIHGHLCLPLALGFFLLICSCASMKITPQESTVRDTFSRSYPMNFPSFHPKVNGALQEYAQKHKGNSFQVIRLGSDTMVIRGRYKRDADQDPFSTAITTKPEGAKRSSVEIKISPVKREASSEYLEKAAEQLFRIIETGIGVRPL